MKRESTAAPLESLRQRCEAYLEAVYREEYLFASGLKPETDLFEIEKNFGDLGSIQAVRLAGKALEEAPGEEQIRVFHLLNFLIDQLMESRTGALRHKLYALQGRSNLRIQGKSLPFRKSQASLAGERDRVVRLLIGSEQHRVFARLNPILLSILRKVHSTSRELNTAGHLELCRRRVGVDLPALGAAAAKLLAETRDLYMEQMERMARQRLGLALDDLRREDMPYLLGDSDYDEAFPADTMISTTEEIVQRVGLETTARGRIAYDLEVREGKSHRACHYPIRVPDELVVSVRPKAGPAALRQLLHEVGQALHRAAIDPSLPFEYRCLGYASGFLASGHLLGRLLLNPDWLSRRPGMANPEALLSLSALKELYFVRLLATNLRYEIVLHASPAPEKQDVVFSEMVAEHCSVRFAPEAFLFFTDLHFYSARYLRGLLLESVLRRRLVERFGAEWFNRREAGRFLRDLWKGGGRLGTTEAMQRLGGREMDFSPLVEDLRSLFR